MRTRLVKALATGTAALLIGISLAFGASRPPTAYGGGPTPTPTPESTNSNPGSAGTGTGGG